MFVCESVQKMKVSSNHSNAINKSKRVELDSDVAQRSPEANLNNAREEGRLLYKMKTNKKKQTI